MSGLIKNVNIGIYSDTINKIWSASNCARSWYVGLMGLSLFLLLSVTLTKVTAMLNSFNWKCCVFCQFSWNFIGLMSKSSREWLQHHFSLGYIFKGDNRHVFWFDHNFLFGGHCLREVFQTLLEYKLAWGLADHARCDDLDRISRSQVCQNQNLHIVFRLLSTTV